MARHQFGLMDCAPQPGERFDQYEPERYGCIGVKDELIDEILLPLRSVRTFWHTPDWSAHGLDEAGITLIPPESAGRMAEVIRGRAELRELSDLMVMAKRMEKWIIHFGI